MSQKWRDAIEYARKRDLTADQKASEELERFIKGLEGKAACSLLVVAKKQILFDTIDEGNDLKSEWLLTHKGFIRSTQHKEGQTGASPTEVTLGAQMLVLELTRRTTAFKDPTSILPFLLKELDTIADQILAL